METLLAEHSTLGQVVWDTVDVFLNHPTAMGKFSKAGEVLNVSPIKCRRHRDREPSRAPPRLAYTSTQRTGQIDYANASLGLRFSPTSLACSDAEFVVRELRRPRTSPRVGVLRSRLLQAPLPTGKRRFLRSAGRGLELWTSTRGMPGDNPVTRYRLRVNELAVYRQDRGEGGANAFGDFRVR